MFCFRDEYAPPKAFRKIYRPQICFIAMIPNSSPRRNFTRPVNTFQSYICCKYGGYSFRDIEINKIPARQLLSARMQFEFDTTAFIAYSNWSSRS